MTFQHKQNKNSKMTQTQAIQWAIEELGFPVMSTKEELRVHYYAVAKNLHPDCGGDEVKMARANEAYEILKTYIEHFKFTFSEEEIAKQFPQDLHVNKFRF